MIDVFISYSRADQPFAHKLEQALGNYRPPRSLKLPQRNISVFRDESDLTGVEYHQAIDRYLSQASKLIVVCSPSARRSHRGGCWTQRRPLTAARRSTQRNSARC